MRPTIARSSIRAIIELEDPWRFNTGQKLYVRGWDQGHSVEVIQRIPQDEIKSFVKLEEAMASAITAGMPIVPVYECRDHLGGIHLLSQIELAVNPIPQD